MNTDQHKSMDETGEEATDKLSEELAAASVSERLLSSKKGRENVPSFSVELEGKAQTAEDAARPKNENAENTEPPKAVADQVEKKEGVTEALSDDILMPDAETGLVARTKIGEDGKERELTKEEMVEEALNCPCIAAMKEGPCGEKFLSAYKCFLVSEAEPQGMDCIEAFQAMHSCVSEHPEEYNTDAFEQEADQNGKESVEKGNSDVNTKVGETDSTILSTESEKGEKAIERGVDNEVPPKTIQAETGQEKPSD